MIHKSCLIYYPYFIKCVLFLLKRYVFLPPNLIKPTFLKTYSNKIILFIVVLAAVYACSTKKNTFVNRNFHALNTKFNVLFNGDVALEKGVEELKISYKDNFWDILPLERLDVSDEMVELGVKKNPNFERAETKATKAIQKHSMNIDGYEYNYQMDEAHLTLGESR